MATVQTKVLNEIKETRMISTTKGTPDEEVAILQKLEAFGVLRKESHSFRPTARFYKYADQLIEQEIPVEKFAFDDLPSSQQTFNNTIHAQSIGQINQGSGNFSFEQINIEIVKESLKNELTKEQIEEVMQVLKEKGKSGVIQKLKNFGSDVLANVMAGILSNPALYG
ncbi:hypothetical protein [Algoriphagus halophytocola]|uniref:Uncharacterized protein n=1 Tax=Algoriphagus halophytocola TaxID=2991499 RepID=A0ABY6MBY1_9BACT|nr:hypothetical protein [Algoriphagus sp. TR-M5]UZD21155.1 hypothetical protein OM944_10765 [Algoriphagus sp. TR-M5]